MAPRPPRESELDCLPSPGVDICDWKSRVTGAALLGGVSPLIPTFQLTMKSSWRPGVRVSS